MGSPALGLDYMLSKLSGMPNNPSLQRVNSEFEEGDGRLANGGLSMATTPSRHSTPSFDLTNLLASASNPSPADNSIRNNSNNSGGNETIWQNFSKNLMKEKKKFNSDVSDLLVVEVLKRKELLVENNTSRDLTFSENKRNAWNEVRRLLIDRFPYFDLNVEAIKSHWRYRKRKVTDAYQDLKVGEFEAGKIQGKISVVDYEIYEMLKDSNLLEKCKQDNSTASPSEGEGPDNVSVDDNPADQHSSISQNFLAQPSIIGNNFLNMSTANPPDPRACLERLAAALWGSKLAQQQQQTIDDQQHGYMAGNSGGGSDQSSVPITSCSSSVSPPAGFEDNENEGEVGNGAVGSEGRKRRMVDDCNNNDTISEFDISKLFSVADSAFNRASCDAEKTTSTQVPRRKRLKRSEAAAVADQASSEWVSGQDHPTQNAAAPPTSSNNASSTLEECQKHALAAQREAFDELKSLIIDIKSSIVPQVLLALQKYNNINSDDGPHADGL